MIEVDRGAEQNQIIRIECGGEQTRKAKLRKGPFAVGSYKAACPSDDKGLVRLTNESLDSNKSEAIGDLQSRIYRCAEPEIRSTRGRLDIVFIEEIIDIQLRAPILIVSI